MIERNSVRWQWLAAPALLIAVLLCWHACITYSDVSPLILPGPMAVGSALLTLIARLSTWGHVFTTLRETLLGFFVALVAGVCTGYFVGKFRWVEQTLRPFVITVQVIPKVALIPLFIVWLGFGSTSKIITAAVMGFFPIFTNTVLGIKSIDAGYRDVMTGLNASRWQRFICLDIHATAPYIFSATEMAVILSLMGCVVGQFLTGNDGLGYLLISKMNAYETDSLFACIALLAGIGLALHVLVAIARRILVPWHATAL
jgi:NitT/TauT family transport system permease protein